jgi:hypothetical protein
MRHKLGAVALMLFGLTINNALAESRAGEILEIKQSSSGGTNPQRDATLIVRLDDFSGSDTQCSKDDQTTLILTSDKARYEQMMQIALSALLSGRRIGTWFTIGAQGCSLYAISIQR